MHVFNRKVQFVCWSKVEKQERIPQTLIVLDGLKMQRRGTGGKRAEVRISLNKKGKPYWPGTWRAVARPPTTTDRLGKSS